VSSEPYAGKVDQDHGDERRLQPRSVLIALIAPPF
jgi:hypothetical protein